MKVDPRNCLMCPRKCGADRYSVNEKSEIAEGYCGASWEIEVSKIMLHHWEEPPISGYDTSDTLHGSGAIFFTHCSIGCVYCQNSKISRKKSSGKKYSTQALALEMLKLQENGAYNINLVSPTHYTVQLIETVKNAREMGLKLPIVWNTGGYDLPEMIKALSETVDIFLTDLKYSSAELAKRLSNAADYPEVSFAALSAMCENVGEYELDENGTMKRGVIVRHLVLPAHRDDSIKLLRALAESVPPNKIILSLMAQYTPEFLPPKTESDEYREIRRKITTYEYGKVYDEAIRLGFEGFMQERSSATKRFTPDF